MVNKAYRVALPFLALWLISWIVLSWAAIQDDALIHLRYAENLLRTHLISYDGVHPNYGTSSLLYVSLLAFLGAFIKSPNLPRAVSSCAHLLLVGGLTCFLIKFVPRQSSRARILGLILLFLLATPSSVRWLDDGMETGLVLCFTAILCIASFRQFSRETTIGREYLAFVALALFTVLLRTELALLCGIAGAILVCKNIVRHGSAVRPGQWFQSAVGSSHLFVGSLLALAVIFLKMHALLPDTAIAKSDGIANWQGVFSSSATVLVGAFSFGVGFLLLWLLTLFLLLRTGRISLPTIIANALFPLVLLLAALRGQQIQGARYLVWALFFSALWNILELGSTPSATPRNRQGLTLAWGFFALVLIAQPFESITMYRILEARAKTMRAFQSQHLNSLEGKTGVATDVGYMGYFSKATICDLAGLVNGREAASLSQNARAAACAALHPDFVFLNRGQIDFFSQFMPLTDWKVCSRYDFINVRSPDTHYLMAPSSTAAEICRSTSGSAPTPNAELLRAAVAR